MKKDTALIIFNMYLIGWYLYDGIYNALLLLTIIYFVIYIILEILFIIKSLSIKTQHGGKLYGRHK